MCYSICQTYSLSALRRNCTERQARTPTCCRLVDTHCNCTPLALSLAHTQTHECGDQCEWNVFVQSLHFDSMSAKSIYLTIVYIYIYIYKNPENCFLFVESFSQSAL